MTNKAAPKDKPPPPEYSLEEIEKLRGILEKLRKKGFAIYAPNAPVWKRVLGRWEESPISPVLKLMYLLEEAEGGPPLHKAARYRHLRDIGNEIAIEFSANNAEYFTILARYLKGRKSHEVPLDDLSPAKMGLPKKRGRAGRVDNLDVIFPMVLIDLIAKRLPGGVPWYPIPPKAKPSEQETEQTKIDIPTEYFSRDPQFKLDPQSKPPLQAWDSARITRDVINKAVKEFRGACISESELSRQIVKWGIAAFVAEQPIARKRLKTG